MDAIIKGCISANSADGTCLHMDNITAECTIFCCPRLSEKAKEAVEILESIKAWDIEKAMKSDYRLGLPIEIRKRMQSILEG